MTEEQMKNLGVGDAIIHASGGFPHIVTANFGSRVTAVRTVDMTNASEWHLVRKVASVDREYSK